MLKNCKEQEEAIAETASKLADKTGSLTQRERPGRTRRGSRHALNLEAVERKLTEARKRLRSSEEARAEANAITEQAEEEAKGVARAKANVCNDGWSIAENPLIKID